MTRTNWLRLPLISRISSLNVGQLLDRQDNDLFEAQRWLDSMERLAKEATQIQQSLKQSPLFSYAYQEAGFNSARVVLHHLSSDLLRSAPIDPELQCLAQRTPVVATLEMRRDPAVQELVIHGRCEQVFVTGYPLRQVLKRERLERGSFYVDEDAKLLYGPSFLRGRSGPPTPADRGLAQVVVLFHPARGGNPHPLCPEPFHTGLEAVLIQPLWLVEGYQCPIHDDAFLAVIAVRHQVHFSKPGSVLLPVRKGPDRDLASEQGAGLGRPPALGREALPCGTEQAVDGHGA